ncbi:MAG: S8 family serine peptidase [Clostridiales Family XIII bacterium]|jgi:uncharacterized repeat protein (TIGR02543 family)|nr:S8 family serine peptidase [Clostridiales Family XIII bacterium]
MRIRKSISFILTLVMVCSVALAPFAAFAESVPASTPSPAKAAFSEGAASPEDLGAASDEALPAGVAGDPPGTAIPLAEAAEVAGPAAEYDYGADCNPAEIIVVMKEGVDEEAVVESSDEITMAAPLGDGEKIVVVETAAEDIETAIAQYESNPDVEYAQPNFRYSLMEDVSGGGAGAVGALYAPNDPSYGSQWALQAGASTQISQAWDAPALAGAGKIRVGVLDTGAQLDHPDLQANINASLAYDIPGATAAVTDTTVNGGGHGTHVAGIIAAVSNNGIGVAGVSDNHVELVPIDIFSTEAGNQTSTTSMMVQGISLAISKGCKIINISAGGTSHDPALLTAVDNAKQQGALVVAAAGNNGTAVPVYPSDYSSVVSVTATTNTDAIASSYSSFNMNKDIAAPGTGIYSTIPGSAYDYKSGTSMAAPYVAAVAALVWAARPSLTRNQVEGILYSTATDLGASGKDQYFGNGLVNAQAAVAKAASFYCTVTFKNYDGAAIGTQVVENGGSAAAPPQPARTGYTFTGWDTGFANVTSDLTVTARFSPNTYTVFFSANGGPAPSFGSKQVIYDAAIGYLPAIAARAGYTFQGWYTAASGGTQITAATVYKTAGNTICYAQYAGVKNSWVQDGDKSYWFGAGGNPVAGWQTIGGQARYFDPAQGGAAPQGWFAHSNGKVYYFWYGGRGAFATGLSEIGGRSYYFNAQGHVESGWQMIGGQARYFDPAQGGAAPQGWFAHSNGKVYYFWWGGSGAFATGLSGIGGRSYYFNAQGHLQ